MAGIYIHIPFCRQACHYCDFHFSTSQKLRTPMVNAIAKELQLRKGFLSGESVETIYFGGGTPSVLNAPEFEVLFEEINRSFSISNNPEISIEANPDDLSPEKVSELRRFPFNRFSIGIQSFREEDLRWMNRAHDSEQAMASVANVQAAGFENITIDLIYGIPGMSQSDWEKNVQTAIDLGVPHISSYCLTVEPGTALGKFVMTGKVPDVNDDHANKQFQTLVDMLKSAGFDQYEVSNFGKPGFYSQHNSSYWKNKTYLGVGPSAHSFNGNQRSWNLANNARYIQAINQGTPFRESEDIDRQMAYNEYVMTGLRTIWGIDLDFIKNRFQIDLQSEFSGHLNQIIQKQYAEISNGKLVLNSKGLFYADGIASDFFLVED